MPPVHPELPIHIHHDGQLGSRQIKQENSCLVLQSTQKMTLTGMVRVLTIRSLCSTALTRLDLFEVSFVRSLNSGPHLRTFPEGPKTLCVRHLRLRRAEGLRLFGYTVL